MDVLLQKVTQQAVQYAIRSGITITAGFAIKECGRLLSQAPRGKERQELLQLQLRLESKIRVIAPSIDMIELIAARGNTSLDSAVSLTKDIRYDIQKLGRRLQYATDEEKLRRNSNRGRSREESDHELREIITQIRLLLSRIEDAVPLINLAITTSGVNLSTKLSGTISPSRLLQASTFLTAADSRFTANPKMRQQVGPTYFLTLYMLFASHSSRPVDENGTRQTTWKEVIHKAQVKLWRVPLEQLYDLPGRRSLLDCSHDDRIPADAMAGEFAYQLVLVEDQADGRHHDPQEEPSRSFGDIPAAGIADVIPCHEIAKIFYADRGKILNIDNDDGTNNPVLLLKRDVCAEPPRRMMRRPDSRASTRVESEAESVHGESEEADEQSQIDAQIERDSHPPTPLKETACESDASRIWQLPADLDPEWMAFEVYGDYDDSEHDSDSQSEDEESGAGKRRSTEPGLVNAFSSLNLRSSSAASSNPDNQPNALQSAVLHTSPSTWAPPIKTSLSLLEMLMKLAALQQFKQDSHLAIDDELLNFFLENSATAGAGADKEHRRRLRSDAARRVGFDPYDESPVKRRGGDRIQRPYDVPTHSASPDAAASDPGCAYDDEYEYGEDLQWPIPRLDFTAQPSIARPQQQPQASSHGLQQYQQTPSRSSTPDSSSEQHRNDVYARYSPGKSPQGHQPRRAAATPPGSAKTRAGMLRLSSDEPRPRSPLNKEVMNP